MGLANKHVRILSLMAGRFPGESLTLDDIAESRAFNTLDRFVAYELGLLAKFERGRYTFGEFTWPERDTLIHLLRRGKGHYFKPATALAHMWGLSSPDDLGAWMALDDSGEVMRFCRGTTTPDQVIPVQTPNPFADKPWHEVQETGKFTIGKARAVQRLVETEPRSYYMHSLRAYLDRCLESRQRGDAPPVSFGLTRTPGPTWRRHSAHAEGSHTDFHWKLEPVPRGTVFQVHDTASNAYRFLEGYLQPTERLKDEIARVREAAGGLDAIERVFSNAR